MKKIALCLMIALAMSSCIQDPTKDLTTNTGTDTDADNANVEKIYASFVEKGENSRVELTKALHLAWTEGDIVYVVGPNTQKKYKFDGKTGDRSGSFSLVESYEPLDVELDRYYAVAPFHSITVTEDKQIRFNSSEVSSSVQKYNPNVCSSVENNMVYATSEDGENFQFWSILGYLRLSLTGEKVVKNISFTNKAGKNISGRFHIYTDTPTTVWLKSDYNPLPSITMDCGEGVQLSDTPTDFYFTFKPVTMTDGITLDVEFTDGSRYFHATSKEIKIEQNAIQPMAVISTTNTEGLQYLNITHEGETINIPTISGGSALSGYINLGDGSTSLLNLLTRYDYTDGKRSHSLSIVARDANKVVLNNCEGITKLDISNF